MPVLLFILWKTSNLEIKITWFLSHQVSPTAVAWSARYVALYFEWFILLGSACFLEFWEKIAVCSLLKLWQNKMGRNLFEMPTKNDVFFSAAIGPSYFVRELSQITFAVPKSKWMFQLRSPILKLLKPGWGCQSSQKSLKSHGCWGWSNLWSPC